MPTPMRILIILGTRPEAIKLAPIILRLQKERACRVRVCVTGQHRQMLDQVLKLFAITPEHDLDLMRPDQGLSELSARILQGIQPLLQDERPDWVVVQGDTTTAFIGALAGFYAGIRVAHVEAGLRTGDRFQPWPEEVNRRMVSSLADLHCAPTGTARDNLLREGIPGEDIVVTGNTVIDALLMARDMVSNRQDLSVTMKKVFSFLDSGRKLILVTGHRRENFGDGFRNICHALVRLASRPDAQIVYPVHLNPNVQQPVNELLGNCGHVHLLPPQEYLPFVYLMERAHIVITDSGGIQEEAPSLGKPVLVMRRTTERPEAVQAGTAKLVGTDPERIVAAANELMDDAQAYQAMSQAHNPYGDGCAAQRICDCLQAH